MGKLDGAIREISLLEEQAGKDQWMNRIHPLIKLSLTVLYLVLTVSVHRYDLSGLLQMGIYPLILFLAWDIPFGQCLKRIRLIFPLLVIMGIFNPLFDRAPLFFLGNIPVTGGLVSMATLILKGFLTVLAVYLLVITTSIDKICGSLQLLHMPQILVTTFLLIYRYLFLLLQEADRITQAYALRAPGQKGIHFRAWGSLVGLLLLRSIDRATEIYESMRLRGFASGESSQGFRYAVSGRFRAADILWGLIWAALLLLLRYIPVFELVGGTII